MNNNNNNNKISMSILMFFISIFLIMNGVSAVSLIYDQPTVEGHLNDYNLGMSVQQFIIGTDNSLLIANYTGDYKFNLRNVQDSVFVLIENSEANTTMDIIWINNDPKPLNTTTIAYQQEVIMLESGTYWFEFNPAYTGENFDILIELPDGKVYNSYIIERVPDGNFGTIFTPLINNIVTLIEININMWRLVFYLFIVALSVGFISSLFIVAWAVFKYGQKTKDSKHSIYEFGNSNNNNNKKEDD